MSKERLRNRDARDGDVVINDSVASGTPDLPIDEDPGRETNVAIDADRLRERAQEQSESAERGREADASRRPED